MQRKEPGSIGILYSIIHSCTGGSIRPCCTACVATLGGRVTIAIMLQQHHLFGGCAMNIKGMFCLMIVDMTVCVK